MSLWHKAWRESRARFLLGAALLAALCLVVVLFQGRLRADPGLPNFRSSTFAEHVYLFVYAGSGKGMYLVLVAPFLGLCGLRRERAHGTAPFTLALPVDRVRLSAVPVAVGVVEAAVLALLPACLIPPASALVGESYSFLEAARFSLLWFACGLVILAAAYLYSVVLSGEYTAPIACIATLFAVDFLVSTRALMPYHLKLGWIAGGYAFRGPGAAQNGAALDPIPWMHLFGLGVVSLVLIAIGIAITRRQDF